MKKVIIRLTENDLHNIIKNSVRDILRENDFGERHVLKIAHKNNGIDDDLSPMGDIGNDDLGIDPMGGGTNDDMNADPMGGGSNDDMNSDPMGGDDMSADPIGDGSDDMNADPMGSGNNDDMNADPMGGGSDDMNVGSMGGGNSNTQEIDDIFSNLGVEDQSAVLKYAKSMSNNDTSNMPNESITKHINDVINEVLDIERGTNRTSTRQIKDINPDLPYGSIWTTHR